MRSAPFTVQVGLVRSPALASVLRRADALLCAVLCGVVHFVCWLIAICCFIIWCAYRLVCRLVWLIEHVGMMCVYMVGIVWVIIVWIGRRFVCIVIVLLRLLRQLGRALRRGAGALIRWAIREFGEPVVCTTCVYLGVLSTSILPLVIALQLAPAAVAGLVLSPLAAFVVAARVFDTRAYSRWQRGARARLGARVLRAYSDGVTWGVWLRMPKAAGRSAG
jgi:hypothetical protein